MTRPSVLPGISLVPVLRLEQATERDGYVKVKLFFTTEEPKHIRSYGLQHSYGFKGPFMEDVCVLLPQAEVAPEFERFIPIMARLQLVCGVVSKTAQLKDFRILDEDTLTLAYVLD